MLGLSTSVMILVAALNFWACVVSKDVPGQLQHQQVVDHAQPDKTIANQTAKIVANQNAVIHGLHMEIEQLKSGENSTSVIQALKAELQAQQRQATAAKIQALETELESQKKLAVMIQALEAKKRDEADEREFRAKVEAQQAQQSAALEDLQQKVADREERPTARQRLKIHKEKGRRGLQGTSACKYDVIEDGRVDVADLLQVLADFHLESCKLRADFNGDCIVNVADLLSLLSAFGGTVSDSDCNMGHSDVAPVAYSHRWLQVTAAGRTVAENSAGPPAPCAANIVGAVYFDTDIAEFLGCTGTSWEPLGGSKGNFLCRDGWGGGSCDADFRAPIITCEAGTVSVQQEPNVFPHTLTAADIPVPQVRDTGPGNPGHTRVELRVSGVVDGVTTWASVEPYFTLFDFGTATLSDGLSIDVDIDSITTFEYHATDFQGNTASCTVDVHVADVDECDDGNPTHNCADNAVCENLYNTRGEYSIGTYNCTCPQTFVGDGYILCEPAAVVRVGGSLITVSGGGDNIWRDPLLVVEGVAATADRPYVLQNVPDIILGRQIIPHTAWPRFSSSEAYVVISVSSPGIIFIWTYPNFSGALLNDILPTRGWTLEDSLGMVSTYNPDTPLNLWSYVAEVGEIRLGPLSSYGTFGFFFG